MNESYHVHMNILDSSGKKIKLKPKTDASDVDVKPKNNIPVEATDLDKVLLSLGDLAFQDNISIPEAGIEQHGVVQLSNETNDTSVTGEKTAATTKAVSLVSNNSLTKNGDESVDGVKNFKNGLQIGDATMTYSVDTSGSKILNIGIN